MIFYEGYHIYLEHAARTAELNKVTFKQYAAYRLMNRGERCHINMTKKLFQHIICDYYVRAENNDLRFLKANQKLLRREKYTSLKRFLDNKAARLGLIPGQIYVIPSGFTVRTLTLYFS